MLLATLWEVAYREESDIAHRQIFEVQSLKGVLSKTSKRKGGEHREAELSTGKSIKMKYLSAVVATVAVGTLECRDWLFCVYE